MKKSTKLLLFFLVILVLCPSFLFAAEAAQTDGQGSADLSAIELIPGGIPFGVKFTTDGVLIVGFCDIEQDGAKSNPARHVLITITL